MILQHLGPLHPAEQALTFGLAFGPFVVLAVVVWIRRRQDAAEERSEAPDREPGQGRGDVNGPATPGPSGSPTSGP